MARSHEEPDSVRLSKLLSFLLRHRPDALGLELDAEGWTELPRLIERINAKRRLPFTLERRHVVELAEGEGRRRFELKEGRLRARGGHSVDGVDADPANGTPDFLYLTVDIADAAEAELDGECRGDLTLVPDEPEEPAGGDVVLVVEAARAIRGGVKIEEVGGRRWKALTIPAKYVLNLRPGFVRQISAGGVLVRGRGQGAEFALIRTVPRDQTAEAEPAEFQDPRGQGDRRRHTDRRRGDRAEPPAGVERRRGASRRQRRRRRSGRWGVDGRLELPKGKLEDGETPEQAAVREVREELGVTEALTVEASLSANHYVFRTPEGSSIFKTVHYYLLRCPEDAPAFTPARAEGIVGVEWWSAKRAIEQVAFKNLRPVLEQAWELVQ